MGAFERFNQRFIESINTVGELDYLLCFSITALPPSVCFWEIGICLVGFELNLRGGLFFSRPPRSRTLSSRGSPVPLACALCLSGRRLGGCSPAADADARRQIPRYLSSGPRPATSTQQVLILLKQQNNVLALMR